MIRTFTLMAFGVLLVFSFESQAATDEREAEASQEFEAVTDLIEGYEERSLSKPIEANNKNWEELSIEELIALRTGLLEFSPQADTSAIDERIRSLSFDFNNSNEARHLETRQLFERAQRQGRAPIFENSEPIIATERSLLQRMGTSERYGDSSSIPINEIEVSPLVIALSDVLHRHEFAREDLNQTETEIFKDYLGRVVTRLNKNLSPDDVATQIDLAIKQHGNSPALGIMAYSFTLVDRSEYYNQFAAQIMLMPLLHQFAPELNRTISEQLPFIAIFPSIKPESYESTREEIEAYFDDVMKFTDRPELKDVSGFAEANERLQNFMGLTFGIIAGGERLLSPSFQHPEFSMNDVAGVAFDRELVGKTFAAALDPGRDQPFENIIQLRHEEGRPSKAIGIHPVTGKPVLNPSNQSRDANRSAIDEQDTQFVLVPDPAFSEENSAPDRPQIRAGGPSGAFPESGGTRHVPETSALRTWSKPEVAWARVGAATIFLNSVIGATRDFTIGVAAVLTPEPGTTVAGLFLIGQSVHTMYGAIEEARENLAVINQEQCRLDGRSCAQPVAPDNSGEGGGDNGSEGGSDNGGEGGSDNGGEGGGDNGSEGGSDNGGEGGSDNGGEGGSDNGGEGGGGEGGSDNGGEPTTKLPVGGDKREVAATSGLSSTGRSIDSTPTTSVSVYAPGGFGSGGPIIATAWRQIAPYINVYVPPGRETEPGVQEEPTIPEMCKYTYCYEPHEMNNDVPPGDRKVKRVRFEQDCTRTECPRHYERPTVTPPGGHGGFCHGNVTCYMSFDRLSLQDGDLGNTLKQLNDREMCITSAYAGNIILYCPLNQAPADPVVFSE